MCARQCRVTSPKFDPPPAKHGHLNRRTLSPTTIRTGSPSFSLLSVPRDGFPVSCLLFVLLKDVASGHRTGNNSVAVVLGYRERGGQKPWETGTPLGAPCRSEADPQLTTGTAHPRRLSAIGPHVPWSPSTCTCQTRPFKTSAQRTMWVRSRL